MACGGIDPAAETPGRAGSTRLVERWRATLRACGSHRSRSVRSQTGPRWVRICNDEVTGEGVGGCDGRLGLVSGSLPDGTVTFLFTDIEGSTRLLQRLGAGYIDVLGTHARLVRETAAQHGGYELDTSGDSFFIAFAAAGEGVAAAVDAQRALLGFPWPHGSPVLVRMGLHTGTAAIVNADYVGFDVHRASRIASAAHGGQVVVSAETHAAVEGTVDGVTFADLGEHLLKDLDEPEHLRQVLAQGLPTGFAPLRSLEPPTNIPRRAGTLVGRRREFAELRTLICDAAARIVTVTGPGGTGKTRLAGAIALEALVDFSGGAWFVDLTAVTDADQVVVEIATVVGVSLESGRPPLDLVVETIGRRRVLLLLDNFEHVIAAARVVARLVERCPRVTVVVTSRVVLSLRDEVVFPVAPLGLPLGRTRDAVEQSDAGALFVERARMARPDFRLSDANAAVVAEVCELVDGLPLAIELAAARIKVFTADQLRQRLDQRLRLLTGGPSDAPQRHQTMQATIEWSFRLLPPAEQMLLRNLAVFSGGATLDAIAHVVTVDDEAAEPLTALVDHSLVRQIADEHGDVRFDLLHVIGEYARSQLDISSDAQQVRDRHARYYLGLAEAASAAGDDDTLGREHDNLRAALNSLLERAGVGDWDAAELCMRLANSLGQFWYRHGHLQVGISLLERTLGPASDVDEVQRATALRFLGTLLETRRDVSGARACFEEALGIYQRRGDRTGEAKCLNSLGVVARTAGDLTAAETYFVESLALRRELGDVPGTANRLSNLALVLVDRGEIGRALDLLAEAENLDRAAGDQWGIACSANNRGVAHLLDGHPEIGEPLIADALRAFVEFGDDDGVAESLEALAGIAAAKHDPIRTLRLASASDALRERAGIPPVGIDRQRLDHWITQASAALTADAVARAQDQGRQMTTDQAVRYALEETITTLR
jgi:predicted ATPase/class 3 adenylate cyclase